MTEVLVIEDDQPTQQMMFELLSHLGYRVIAASSGREGLDVARRRHPDVVLLDLGLPDIPGIEIIRRLRTWSRAPILVLSGSRQRRRKADALDAGADDFIDKPFDVSELRARLRVAERRLGAEAGRIGWRTFSDLDVDYTNKRVHRGETEVVLTETEWLLFEAMSREPGRLVTHHWLATQVWGGHAGPQQHETMRTHVKSLRAKLGDNARDPRFVRTEVGIGYRWVCSPTPIRSGFVDTAHLLRSVLEVRDLAEAWATSAAGESAARDGSRVTSLVDQVLDIVRESQGPD